jgi:hypothetical protein
MDPDSDPDPGIFVIDLQGANKKLFFSQSLNCVLSVLFKGVHLHNFSKIKSQKEVTKQ